jgi:catechol 2,3-dioxygenase-like lactoylglutathione lyase family enzyme
MNILCIKETCIYVKDLHRTKNFYASQLGLPLISLVENRHVFFRAGSSVLLCFLAQETLKETVLPPHGAEGKVHFAFEVDHNQYPLSLDHIKTLGIDIIHEHSWKNGVRSFYFLDPDDNVVEIIEQGLWEV